MLPIKSQNPPDRFPYGTIGLIVASCIIFIATSNGVYASGDVLSHYGLTRANCGIVTLFTHMFVHGELWTAVGNMWFLYLFGFGVEGKLGTPKFLLLYVVAGMAGGLLHMPFAAHGSDLPLVGATGAVMGVLGAALYLFPHSLILFVWFLVTSWGVMLWRVYWVAVYYVGFDALAAVWHSPHVASGLPHVMQIVGGVVAGGVASFALRGKRDSFDTSEAKAMYAGVKDLKFLSARELAAMAQANPTDTNVVLNWATRSLMDVHGINPECLDLFMNLLPKIVDREPAPAVGNALAGLSMKGIHVPSSTMVVLAARIERSGDPRSAAGLYEAVAKDLEADGSDREAACYRLGMLSETRFGNPHQACEYYAELIRLFPGGTFVDQARMRLSALGYKEGP